MIRKTFLLVASIALFSTTVSAQNWIDMGPFPPDSSFTLATHGIAVDAEGKVWIDQSVRDWALDMKGDTLEDANGNPFQSAPLYVYNPDGTLAMDPIHTLGGDTLGSFPNPFISGVQTDHNGDIIVVARTSGSTGDIYRFDHKTGEVSGTTNIDPYSPASPGIDANGNIYFASVGASGSAIPIYTSDFNFAGTVVTSTDAGGKGKPGIGRNLSVSADGNSVYWGLSIAWPRHGLVKFTRPDEFSPFTTDFTITDTDTTGFVHEGLVSESSTRHPITGHIWFGNAPSCCGAGNPDNLDYYEDYTVLTWYGIDPATDELVDSLNYNLPGEYDGQKTRAIGFSPDGIYAYVGLYDTGGVISVKRFMRGQVTNIQRDPLEIPDGFTLSQNYPNPFNPQTNIEFEMRDAGLASLKVYDLLGREVATLVDEHLVAGKYTATFNATDLPSGSYVYQLDVAGNRLSGKMTLVK